MCIKNTYRAGSREGMLGRNDEIAEIRPKVALNIGSSFDGRREDETGENEGFWRIFIITKRQGDSQDTWHYLNWDLES